MFGDKGIVKVLLERGANFDGADVSSSEYIPLASGIREMLRTSGITVGSHETDDKNHQ